MDIINSIEKINDLINNNEMLLIYFGSDTCGVCNSMMPKIEKMLERFKEIKSVKVEPEKSLELSAKYNVFTIPVIILFIQGKETIREARIISIENFEQKISRYYKLFYEN